MNLTLLDKNERKSIKIVQHQANKTQKEIALEGEREKPKSIFLTFKVTHHLAFAQYSFHICHQPPLHAKMCS